MALLSGENLYKKFDDLIILENVSFVLQQNEKIGIVGKNGSGKTTLLELISGKISLDSGKISKAKLCKIDYIRQEKFDNLDMTLFEFATIARQDLVDIRKELKILEHRLQLAPNDKSLVEKFGSLQNKFETNGGFSFENEIKIVLKGLGFPQERHHERLRNFSGGEKNRASLAQALAGNGHLLFLDEPTNHLDIESTSWLENYIKGQNKTVIAVSHDRAFLQSVVSRVWEINRGKLEKYTGSFDHYVVERQIRRDLQQKHFKHQSEKIDRLEKFIQKNMAGQKTKQAQSKLKYLGRIKRLKPPSKDKKNSSIKMESSARSYAHILSIRDLSLGYNNEEILRDINFNLYRGEKAAIVGKNGSGKSTILKSIIGEISPMSGEIQLGNNVEVAYFDQEHADLNFEQSVLESLWELDPVATAEKVRGYLGRFGFTGDESLKKISTLSGGEKTKLSLARLLYHPANFIIFDEPTNHLDIYARETLEQALLNYEGSCLIVSHDRYFLDKIVSKIIHLDNGSVKEYDGNYSYFAEKQAAKTVSVSLKPEISRSKSDYLDYKEKSRQKSKLKRSIKSRRDKIKDLEKQLSETEDQLINKTDKSDWEKLAELEKQKQSFENQILALYHELEKLEGTKVD